MRRAIWMASVGLGMVAALLTAAKPTRADAIMSYDKVVDVGTQQTTTATDYPSIDEAGQIVTLRSGSKGAYTLDPVHLGHFLSVYMHQAGSEANLLPPVLQDLNTGRLMMDCGVVSEKNPEMTSRSNFS